MEEVLICENTRRIKMSRYWAMPSMHTFLIPPIAKVVQKYVGDGKGWIDPFAGENSPAEITNDLNPLKPAKFHLHAKEFGEQLTETYAGILFDPPYSNRQMKEVYEGVGLKYSFEDSQALFQKEKKLFAPKIRGGGIVICCGWNSTGFGKELGFEFIEIMLVAHGGAHNDTIVTVERKFREQLF